VKVVALVRKKEWGSKRKNNVILFDTKIGDLTLNIVWLKGVGEVVQHTQGGSKEGKGKFPVRFNPLGEIPWVGKQIP